MSYFIENNAIPSPFVSYFKMLRGALARPISPRLETTFVATVEKIKAPSAKINAFLNLYALDPDESPFVPPSFIQLQVLPLYLQTLAHSDIPFSPFGIILKRHRIESLHPVYAADKLNFISRLTTTSDGGVFSASAFLRDPLSDNEDPKEVWRSELEFVLKKEGRREVGGNKRERFQVDSEFTDSIKSMHVLESEEWDLTQNLGRQFALISNDFNPIHLSFLTARIFGFRKAIAHGLWVQGRLDTFFIKKMYDQAITGTVPYSFETQFIRPLYLPSRSQFDLLEPIDSTNNSTYSYRVTHRERPKISIAGSLHLTNS